VLTVVLGAQGGGHDLRTAKEKLEQMLNLLQNMDRDTREITLLSTHSAQDVA
jgi:hypothetical protein